MSDCDDSIINSSELQCSASANGNCGSSDSICQCQTSAALSSKIQRCVDNANNAYGSICWTNRVNIYCAGITTTSSSTSSSIPPTTIARTTTSASITGTIRTTSTTTPKLTTSSTTLTTTTSITSSTIEVSTVTKAPPTTDPKTSESKTSEIKTSETTTSGSSTIPVPTPSVVSISTIASSSTSSSSTHAPIPVWNGAGNLLVGYCATPGYTLIDGATASWVPFVGCEGDKTDCCPYAVTNTATATVVETGASTVTIGVGLSSSSIGEEHVTLATTGEFPGPSDQASATLSECPDDYHTVDDGCCPSGYLRWNADMGGQTPCYSTLQTPLTPPPIVATDGLGGLDGAVGGPTQGHKPTSAIVNVVYAMHYPATQPTTQPVKPTMPTSTKIGIGAGSGAAVVAIGVLLLLLFWKSSQQKKERKAIQSERNSMYRNSTRYSMPSQVASNDEVDSWRRTMPPPVPAMSAAQPAVVTPQNVYSPAQHLSQQRASSVPQPAMPEMMTSSPPQQANFQGSEVRYTAGVAGLDSRRQELADPNWRGRYELNAQHGFHR